MHWFKEHCEAMMTINGSLRLKYIAHLLPENILIRTGKFCGIMSRNRAVNIYGERLVWYIQPQGPNLEVCLHD